MSIHKSDRLHHSVKETQQGTYIAKLHHFPLKAEAETEEDAVEHLYWHLEDILGGAIEYEDLSPLWKDNFEALSLSFPQYARTDYDYTDNN